MSKLMVPFETVAVNPALDPEGGYAMRICDQQILEDDSVYEEVIKEETLPLSVKLLKFVVNAVLSATVKTGLRVTIDRIVYEGCVDSTQIATIMRGKGIAVTGLNCQWLEGDSCTLAWTDAGGAEHTADIEPTGSTVTEMHFAWPEALDAVPTGATVQMRFRTRGGIADAEAQPNNKTVTLIAGEVVPTLDKVATTGKDGIVKGEAFEATGANLGFNFATDHVSVTWMEGDTPRQAAIVPLSATADKIAFSACALFDDLEAGTELTFAFELGGKSAAKKSVLLAE